MKANELMIGDWVYGFWTEGSDDAAYGMELHNHFKCEEISYRLEEIENEYGEIFSVEDIKPIPLTEEILKANGFTESTSINGWSCLTYSPCTYWQPMMPRIDLVKFDDKWHVRSQDCKPFNVNGMVQDVHEFQHALRLCRLNELADNFKLT